MTFTLSAMPVSIMCLSFRSRAFTRTTLLITRGQMGCEVFFISTFSATLESFHPLAHFPLHNTD